ncbi:beta-lactamase family protein [Purpureocillium lavendulum]|uniref:Beta-lactamase family protein n=1 Tax=Purpureocillium lavendulum TaxID=1247861 RepID=A0AB34FU48_9HYPO|nr:beta-lactamase family protein [Purpureocillium lavendulum]
MQTSIRSPANAFALGLASLHLPANRRPGSRNGTPDDQQRNRLRAYLPPMADPQVITDTALGPITGQRPTAIMPARRMPGWPPPPPMPFPNGVLSCPHR